jgi:iron complex transport system ATP-binding protein
MRMPYAPSHLPLVAHHICLASGARRLLDALDLTLVGGEMLGILGANGVGKSTLLTVLAGLADPAQGQVALAGVRLGSMPPLTRAQHIGLLPQADESSFFGSVADFVALGLYPFAHAGPALQATLIDWELDTLATRAFDTLSGGERQRARLAQLAIQAPHHYLLDEPLTHLDPAHQARFLAWARARAEAGAALALTLHDPNWAACHCDRLLFLYGDGRWQTGTPATLLDPAALEGLYGAGSAALWRGTRQSGVTQPV